MNIKYKMLYFEESYHTIMYMYVHVHEHARTYRLKPCLQQCALRSQDFAICNREYFGLQNPDRCGSTFGPDSVRKISSLFRVIFRVRKIS